LVLLSLSCSVSNAQIDQTTGNLINNNSWTGIGAYAPDPNTCCSNPAGSQPLYDTTTGTIKFSYGQATVQQSIAVNQALANAGVGVQVNGYSWNYDLRNLNGKGGQGGTDSLVVNTWMTNPYGQNVAGTSTLYNTQFDWTTFGGTQVLPSSVAPSLLGNVGISFSGKDSGYWAGLYGPEVRNVNLRLNYGVDPCATNPAYSTTCAGFSSVVESVNLVPNPNAYAYAGYSIDQSYAINQALGAAGVGSMIHGFRWGYVANANGPYCNSWDMGFFGCWDIRFPSITTNVSITNSAGADIYSVSRTYQNSYNTTNYSYLFPQSQPINALGSFKFTATTNDPQAFIGMMWSKAIYTPDPCVINPLSSPTCPGYFKALGINTGTTTTVDTTVATTGVITNDTNQTTSTPTTTVATTTSGVPTTTATTTSTGSTSDAGTSSQPTTTSQTTGSPSVTASVSPVTATPSANNPQPKVGEITLAGAAPAATKTTSSGPSISQILNIVRAEQSRISAVETAVVTQAVNQAQSAGQAAVQMSESVAATAAAQSNTSGTTQSSSYGGSTMQSQSMSFGVGTSSLMASVSSSTSGVGINAQRYQSSFDTSSTNQSTYSLSLLQPTSIMQQVAPQTSSFTTQSSFRQSVTETENKNEQKSYGKSPLDALMQQQTMMQMSTNIEQRTETVKRNVPNNELAGGVDLTSMMTQPAGFNQYSFMMPDVAFYAPKEIYRNQRNVDNARVMRGLQGGSDALHEEMVKQQYNRGQ
jgi:hypothetical protein